MVYKHFHTIRFFPSKASQAGVAAAAAAQAARLASRAAQSASVAAAAASAGNATATASVTRQSTGFGVRKRGKNRGKHRKTLSFLIEKGKTAMIFSLIYKKWFRQQEKEQTARHCNSPSQSYELPMKNAHSSLKFHDFILLFIPQKVIKRWVPAKTEPQCGCGVFFDPPHDFITSHVFGPCPGTSLQPGSSVECPAGCQHSWQFSGVAVASVASLADLVAAVDFGTAVDAWEIRGPRKNLWETKGIGMLSTGFLQK